MDNELTVEQIIKWLILQDLYEKASRQELGNKGYNLLFSLQTEKGLKNIKYLDIVK